MHSQLIFLDLYSYLMKENINLPLYYGASVEIFRRAEVLRHHLTETEKLLWSKSNNKQIQGFRFGKQHPINKFIVDFYCHKAKLVIELDGEVHEQKEVAEHDKGREYILKNFGLEILRFTNKEVLNDTENVISKIQFKLNSCISSKPL